MIGDFLYELTPRDQTLVPIEPHFEGFSVSENDGSIDADHTVEDGYLYLLHSVAIKGVPGGGQVCSGLACYILPPGKNDTLLLFEALSNNTSLVHGLTPNIFGVAGAPITVDRQFSSLMIPAGWTIRAHGSFNFAGIANTTGLFIFATRIPRGNVAS